MPWVCALVFAFDVLSMQSFVSGKECEAWQESFRFLVWYLIALSRKVLTWQHFHFQIIYSNSSCFVQTCMLRKKKIVIGAEPVAKGKCRSDAEKPHRAWSTSISLKSLIPFLSASLETGTLTSKPLILSRKLQVSGVLFPPMKAVGSVSYEASLTLILSFKWIRAQR